MIHFVIPGAAVGKGRPRAFIRGGRVAMHTPDKTASYENLVKLAAYEAMKSAPPSSHPVEIELFIITQPPESWGKKKKLDAMDGKIRPTTKPDLDNVLKAIADACNEIVWKDDKQIVKATVSKHYGAKAETLVYIREVLA